MKTLYLPIFEAGTFHNNAITQKRGLYNALSEHGECLEWDYLANDRTTLYEGMVIRLNNFQPDLVLTQFHAADVLTAEQIRVLKAQHPHVKWVNWSGDSWAWSLTSDAMLELAKEYDLWLVAAPDVLPVYTEHGVHAAFWQIAWEQSVTPLPDMPAYDVVFLGNVISDQRRALLEFLRTLEGVSVGIYGDSPLADAHNTYNFAEGEALYKNASIAIADMAYVDQKNYVSNRPIQILGAGGALLLHQHVERMDVLLGIEDGVHYVAWQDFDDLKAKITEWNAPAKAAARKKIVAAGQAFVLERHTWNSRVTQLLGLLKGETHDADEPAKPTRRASKGKPNPARSTKRNPRASK